MEADWPEFYRDLVLHNRSVCTNSPYHCMSYDDVVEHQVSEGVSTHPCAHYVAPLTKSSLPVFRLTW